MKSLSAMEFQTLHFYGAQREEKSGRCFLGILTENEVASLLSKDDKNAPDCKNSDFLNALLSPSSSP